MRIAAILVVIVFVFVGIGSILILQFDPNQFRPDLENYFEQVLGTESRLGNLSLRWGITPRLRVQQLEFREPEEHALLLKAEQAVIGLDMASFFKGKIRIQTLTADKPEIFLFRRSDRSWILPNKGPKGLKDALQAGPHTGNAKWSLEFKLNEIKLRNGIFHYNDESVSPSLSIIARGLEVDLRQATLASPMRVAISAALEGKKDQNIFISAHYFPEDDRCMFKMSYGRDTFYAEGLIRTVTKTPRIELKSAIRQLDLASVVPSSWKNRIYLGGYLSAELDGIGVGSSWETLKQTFRARGIVDIRKGSFVNFNVIQEIFKKMSDIPQMKSLRRMQVPPDYLAALQGPDTRFDILQTTFQIGQGRMQISDLRLKDPLYLMEAEGSYGLEELSFRFQAKLVVLENLSQYLLNQAGALDVIRNPMGRLVIPFTLEGKSFEARVAPDLRKVMENIRKKEGPEDNRDEEEEEDE
ncbi:MAG TPA: AsmA-like C-terminal region-containing protein [bacterium]|nr:AsmA-like C-terminal region-containing protein [bacterium]